MHATSCDMTLTVAMIKKPFNPVALDLLIVVMGAQAAVAADKQSFDLKAGHEVTFAVGITDDQVTLSVVRQSPYGSGTTNEGEITVGVSPRDKTLYETVVTREKTSRPVDFLATGFVGGTKIDEAVICGRLDQPSSARIGAVSWRVSLNQFEVRKEGAACQ